VATAGEPYEVACEVMGCAVNYLTESMVACRLYQIWAALTDRFDLRPTERDDARAEMRSAAAGWSAAKDESGERDAYLDHWQYDILGYKR
jgi:hypothetical protein